MSFSVNETNSYINAFKEMNQKAYELIEQSKQNNPSSDYETSRIHNEAVSVSISTQSMNNYLNIKGAEASKGNATAQDILSKIINDKNYLDFFDGKEMDNGFSLKSIGYEGKELSKLTKDEATDLVSENGFFGIEQTSLRVSSFVLNMAGDNLEALKQSRDGIVQGFEEALKLFGGELPEISYKTQEKTLEAIDKRIEELTKTDLEKELDNKE